MNRIDFVCFNHMSSGQALGGIVVTLMVILSSVVFKSEVVVREGEINQEKIEIVDQYNMAIAFFGMTAFAIFLVIIIWRWLMQNAYVAERLEHFNEESQQQNLLKEKDDSVLPSTYNKMIDKKAMNKYTSDLIKAIKTTRYPFFGLILCMAITYSVYPAVTQRGVSECTTLSTNETSLQSFYCKYVGGEMYPLFYCFLCSQIVNFIGQYAVGFYRPIKVDQDYLLVGFLILRLIPAYLLLFTRRDNYNNQAISLLSKDYLAWLINITHMLFGGYGQILCYNYIPMKIEKKEDQHLAGDLIVYGSSGGILLGSLFSFFTVLYIS